MPNLLNVWDENQQKYIGIPVIQGSSGIHYGSTEPIDPVHPIWINPDGEDTEDIYALITALQNKDTEIEGSITTLTNKDTELENSITTLDSSVFKKDNVSNTHVDSTDKVPTSALVNTMNDKLTDSGWINLDSKGIVKYRKKNGFVTIIGLSGEEIGMLSASASGTTIGTLPSGYRPSYEVIGIGSSRNNDGYEMQFGISTAGVVKIIYLCANTGNNYWAFNVIYPVD